MALKQTPVRTATHASGTGVWISKITEAAGEVEEPVTLARFTLEDPDDFVRDIGWAQYQFRMVKNYNVEGVNPIPKHACLLHCHKIQKILIVPVFEDGDVAVSRAWVETYCDVSNVAEFATALAAVPIEDPAPGASPIEIVTTVMSIPTAGDKLGVQLFPRGKSGHVAPASPAVSGTDLGFSGSELTDWQWKGFAAYRDEADTDLIRVIAGLEKVGEARAQIGDLSKTANYTFIMKESDGSLVSGATLVAVDIPFIPHQLVRGRPVSTSAGNKILTFWCIGRSDPEFVNRTLSNAQRLNTAPLTNGIASAGGIGVWATQDPSLTSWERYHVPPGGISHMGTQNLNEGSTAHTEGPRDLGIMYQPVFQRLTPLIVDTDSSQDPVEEMGSTTTAPPPPP